MKVFLVDCSRLPDPFDAPELLGRLSKDRRGSSLRPVLPEKRREAFGAGLLLAEILPRYGADPERICLTERGKPYCKGVWLSLSHSGGWAALSVSERGEVGCDLERMRPVPARIMSRLRAEERETVERAREGRERAFLRLWTAKESYLKMTGEGLAALLEVEWRAGRLFREGREVGCTLTVFETAEFCLTVCGGEICEAPITIKLS